MDNGDGNHLPIGTREQLSRLWVLIRFLSLLFGLSFSLFFSCSVLFVSIVMTFCVEYVQLALNIINSCLYVHRISMLSFFFCLEKILWLKPFKWSNRRACCLCSCFLAGFCLLYCMLVGTCFISFSLVFASSCQWLCLCVCNHFSDFIPAPRSNLHILLKSCTIGIFFFYDAYTCFKASFQFLIIFYYNTILSQ